ncbi:MAG: hypothetical protein GTO16_08555 [Candidatus Aminicenantes bacterium]|nr:hypothetical protein [Candidatus Aminicenantes bacterium]
MRKRPRRKRPCRICRRWFTPDPRLKDRQMTCGDDQCKREWHRKKCKEWNRNNADCFRSNYLAKKLNAVTECGEASETSKKLKPKIKSIVVPGSRLKSGLPLSYVQEVIGIEHLIIIEYFGQLLVRRFQVGVKGTSYCKYRKTKTTTPRGVFKMQ